MVAMNVWPTDGAAGSVATEARWRSMGRVWAPSGVVAGQGGELAPSLAFPNLTVQSGAAWVDGHYAELVSNQVLTVTANGLAVVRFDPAANSAELLWRDGASTPTQSPIGTWELPIAKTVGSVLTDLRAMSDPTSKLLAAPPGAPADGQLWATSPAAGIVWLFRYNAAGGTHKWEFVSGPPLTAYDGASAAVNATWALGSPSLTVPRAGIYVASCQCESTATSASRLWMGVTTGSASSPFTQLAPSVGASQFVYATSPELAAAAVPAGALFSATYTTTVAGTAVAARQIRVTPRAIS